MYLAYIYFLLLIVIGYVTFLKMILRRFFLMNIIGAVIITNYQTTKLE